MTLSAGESDATARKSRMVTLNYLGAWAAGALTALGALVFKFGGFFGAFPGALLTIVAGPVAIGFLIAAAWWKRRWPHAGIVQFLPFVWILCWAVLILLSPIQTSSPAP